MDLLRRFCSPCISSSKTERSNLSSSFNQHWIDREVWVCNKQLRCFVFKARVLRGALRLQQTASLFRQG
jgi:hypothetical protein